MSTVEYSVNTVTSGSKKFGGINGVALLSGQAQISWIEGRNDKYTEQHIRISWTTVLNNKQLECRYRVE